MLLKSKTNRPITAFRILDIEADWRLLTYPKDAPNGLCDRDVWTCIKLVTPSEAGRILDRNTKNRRLLRHQVRAIRRRMKHGQAIDYVGNPIVFGGDGRLVDGQHRLEALRGCPPSTAVVMQLVVNASRSSIGEMDRGRRRTAQDNARMSERSDIEEWADNHVKSMIALGGVNGYGGSQAAVADDMIAEAWLLFKEQITFVVDCFVPRRKKDGERSKALPKALPRIVIQAAIDGLCAGGISEETVEEFAKGVREGGLSPNFEKHAGLYAVEKARRSAGDRSHEKKLEVYGVCVRALMNIEAGKVYQKSHQQPSADVALAWRRRNQHLISELYDSGIARGDE